MSDYRTRIRKSCERLPGLVDGRAEARIILEEVYILTRYGLEAAQAQLHQERLKERWQHQTVTVNPQLLRDLRNPPGNANWLDLMAQAADVLDPPAVPESDRC